MNFLSRFCVWTAWAGLALTGSAQPVLFMNTVQAPSGPTTLVPHVPVQGANGPAWRVLAGKLHQLKITTTAAPRPSSDERLGPVRILHIGDSHTSGDYFSDAVRRAMQLEYGDAGPGWLPAGLPRWGRSALVKITASEHWKHRYAYIDKTPPLSLGGAAYETQRPWATLSYTLKNPPATGAAPVSWRLWFRDAPPADALHVYADDTPVALSDAPKEGVLFTPSGHMHEIVLAQMPNKLGVVTTQTQAVALLGMSLEAHTPGVVYDSMGVAGARAAALLGSWDTTATAQVLRVRPPDLVILAFGTNEAYQAHFNPDTYRAELMAVQQWLHTHAPDAAVLLVAPPDALERVGRCAANVRQPCTATASTCGVRSHPNLSLVRQTMQAFAAARGWAYWDWSQVMGGACGAWAWQQDNPPRYRPDGIHLTSEGYETSGLALFNALRHIEQHMGPAEPPFPQPQ